MMKLQSIFCRRENYNFGDIDAKSINTQLSLALKRGIAKEILKKAKEEGKGKNHYKMVETNIKAVKPKSKVATHLLCSLYLILF